VKLPFLIGPLAVFGVCAAVGFGQETPDPLIERARDILLGGVADKNPDMRVQAVLAASIIGAREKVISGAATLLEQDKDVQVRLAAVSCLGDFNDPAVIPILKKALQDPVPEVEFAAAKALFYLKQPMGKQVLVSVLSNQEKASSSYLSRQKRSALRMLHTPSKLFLAAGSVAPFPGVGLGAASVQGILSDPGASARASAVLILENETDAETRDAIKAALSDKEWSVRAAAVHATALWNDPALKQEFVPLFDDKKDAVRFRAAAGYIRLSLVQKH
jgi:HEAT repeat protein